MTLHRSIFISFGVHILIGGCALAFAQYGHISGMRTDTILVSLVGPGPGSPVRAQDQKRLIDKKSSARPAAPKESEQTRRDDPAPDLSVVNPMQKTGADETDQLRENGGGGGSPFGLLTPNQWQLIQAALERAKSYPRMARERGIEGIVHVRFKVLPSGDVERVEVLRSSGHAILDSASVKTVYQSRPLPYVTGWVEVPISYALK